MRGGLKGAEKEVGKQEKEKKVGKERLPRAQMVTKPIDLRVYRYACSPVACRKSISDVQYLSSCTQQL